MNIKVDPVLSDIGARIWAEEAKCYSAQPLTLLDRFTDRHTRIDEMIRNALGHSVCALVDSMSLVESKVWLTDNGYVLNQSQGRVVLTHNGVTIGEVLV